MQLKCIECSKEVKVIPARAHIFKFCSLACRGSWRKKHWTGKNHPGFTGGKRSKKCKECGTLFHKPRNRAISVFKKQKFCSKKCADKGGFRYIGKEHHNYSETARRRNRGGSHHKWVNAVISRDKAICQHCGASGIELHAHHIKSYKDYPDLRFDVDNGITLCFKCHWQLHAALDAKAVNSVDTRKGNTEPSLQRKLLEGVTTRGRAYRRWVGPCDWCGETISKAFSDTKNKRALFCNKHCMGKWNAANRSYRRWKNPVKPTAVTSSTSPAPERDEIV